MDTGTFRKPAQSAQEVVSRLTCLPVVPLFLSSPLEEGGKKTQAKVAGPPGPAYTPGQPDCTPMSGPDRTPLGQAPGR